MEEYVSLSTGEIVEVQNAQNVHRIASAPGKKVLIEMDLDEYEYEVKKRSTNSPKFNRMPWQFTMFNYDDWVEYARRCEPRLTNRDKALVLDLMGYINFDCIVCNRESGTYMSVSEIASEMGWTNRTLLSSLDVLESNKIVMRFQIGRTTHVMLNPALFYRGRSTDYEQCVEKFNTYVAEYNNRNDEKPSNDADSST